MRALALLLLCLFIIPGCDDAAPDGHCRDECLCTDEGCPDGVCGFIISLSETCAAVEPRVELFVAGCLEHVDLTVDAPIIACGTLTAFERGKLVARGASFQWGPTEFECPGRGGLFPIELSCGPPGSE